MSVGDINSDAKGSGARYNDGKPDLSLIPLELLEGEARVWMYGERKYKRFNWMKGMPWSVPLACMLRHLAAYQRGEELDPESGLPHLDHVQCNLRMLQHYAKYYPEGDDRFKGAQPAVTEMSGRTWPCWCGKGPYTFTGYHNDRVNGHSPAGCG